VHGWVTVENEVDIGRRHVTIRTQLRSKGVLVLLLPLMRRTMHKREERDLESVKAILEGKGQRQPRTPR
jgi:hypothetical protein